MSDIKRWYDESSKLGELMKVLSSMSDNEIDQIAHYLYHIVKIYRREVRKNDTLQSIGAEKLFGYYKAYNKRRWYDKKPSLSSAINIMSTFSVKEMDEIVEGFLFALRKEGLYNIYFEKKRAIAEKER